MKSHEPPFNLYEAKSPTTPLEHGLIASVQYSQLGIVLFAFVFLVYAIGGYFSIEFGMIALSYSFLSFGDPILDFLMAVLAVLTLILCLSIISLALLSGRDDVDVLIVILFSFIGIGFSMTVLRVLVPLLTDFLTRFFL